MKRTRTSLLIGAFFLFSLSGFSAIVTTGLIQDLDAANGAIEGGGVGTGVTEWQNQAASGGDDVAAAATPPTLNLSEAFPFVEFGGGATRLIGDDTTAFDSLMQGGGNTWFAVIRADAGDNADAKNGVFGTLTNGNPFSGLVSHVNSDNAAYMLRTSTDVFTIGDPVADSEWHIVVGRLAPGTGSQLAEIFSDSPIADASNSYTVAASTDSDALSVGTPRTGDAGNGEAYFGDVARILIYDRSLSDAELNQTGFELAQLYGISTTFTPEPSAGLLGMLGLVGLAMRRRRGS